MYWKHFAALLALQQATCLYTGENTNNLTPINPLKGEEQNDYEITLIPVTPSVHTKKGFKGKRLINGRVITSKNQSVPHKGRRAPLPTSLTTVPSDLLKFFKNNTPADQILDDIISTFKENTQEDFLAQMIENNRKEKLSHHFAKTLSLLSSNRLQSFAKENICVFQQMLSIASSEKVKMEVLAYAFQSYVKNPEEGPCRNKMLTTIKKNILKRWGKDFETDPKLEQQYDSLDSLSPEEMLSYLHSPFVYVFFPGELIQIMASKIASSLQKKSLTDKVAIEFHDFSVRPLIVESHQSHNERVVRAPDLSLVHPIINESHEDHSKQSARELDESSADQLANEPHESPEDQTASEPHESPEDQSASEPHESRLEELASKPHESHMAALGIRRRISSTEESGSEPHHSHKDELGIRRRNFPAEELQSESNESRSEELKSGNPEPLLGQSKSQQLELLRKLLRINLAPYEIRRENNDYQFATSQFLQELRRIDAPSFSKTLAIFNSIDDVKIFGKISDPSAYRKALKNKLDENAEKLRVSYLNVQLGRWKDGHLLRKLNADMSKCHLGAFQDAYTHWEFHLSSPEETKSLCQALPPCPQFQVWSFRYERNIESAVIKSLLCGDSSLQLEENMNNFIKIEKLNRMNCVNYNELKHHPAFVAVLQKEGLTGAYYQSFLECAEDIKTLADFAQSDFIVLHQNTAFNLAYIGHLNNNHNKNQEAEKLDSEAALHIKLLEFI